MSKRLYSEGLVLFGGYILEYSLAAAVIYSVLETSRVLVGSIVALQRDRRGAERLRAQAQFLDEGGQRPLAFAGAIPCPVESSGASNHLVRRRISQNVARLLPRGLLRREPAPS